MTTKYNNKTRDGARKGVLGGYTQLQMAET